MEQRKRGAGCKVGLERQERGRALGWHGSHLPGTLRAGLPEITHVINMKLTSDTSECHTKPASRIPSQILRKHDNLKRKKKKPHLRKIRDAHKGAGTRGQ